MPTSSEPCLMYKFDEHKDHWQIIPVDDVGYFKAEDLLRQHDDDLSTMIEKMEKARYEGWRNHDNKWRSLLGLDTTKGKTIFDFGCGTGIESRQFTRAGNKVYSADINAANTRLAQKVAGSTPVLVTGEYPFWPDLEFDIFYANGVLHHIPYARKIIERAFECGAQEFRLMLYTDKAWVLSTNTQPGENDEAMRNVFAAAYDFSAAYADWYNAAKLNELFGDILQLKSFEYITPREEYSVAIMERKQ